MAKDLNQITDGVRDIWRRFLVPALIDGPIPMALQVRTLRGSFACINDHNT